MEENSGIPINDNDCLKLEPKSKACPRPKPGEAAGGCAFDGAQITLLPISDAAHLVHGPAACIANSWESRGSHSSGPRLSAYGFGTSLSEQDIIFGAEKKLTRSIEYIAERFKPPAIFVYSTCVTALIGEDLDTVCADVSARLGISVIPVNSPGFVGSKNLGNRLAGESLIQYVIGRTEPERISAYDINLIGEYNIAGEMWDIERLLNRVGISIMSRITGDGRFNEIGHAHRAKVNMVVCSRALLGLAKRMEQTYHIPYFEGSFYGAKETSYSLRQMAYLLNDRDLERRVDRLIKREEARLAIELRPYRQILKGKKAVLYTGGVKSWSVISALKELGIKVVGVGTNKSTAEDINRIEDRVGEDVDYIAEGGAKSIIKAVKDRKADLMIAGGRNMYVALKEQIPFVDINQERHTAYAGYDGLLRLAKQITFAINHPVWEMVERPAPWDVGGDR
ncbi:nitrogenase iron-molybdenum cofactor biosynthesis protein NifE [Paenibacillus anaericanus]|uniref:Nitrogenase iron-molybdenum cofactor biosynthesis protein NifE n=1 Tax=Paenibacillus anaericanus TaxID=170367 RepID=A0A3S1DKY2_9BACL|nr:nitrogenase iron-molybdenum cofactor biosynthesis protein NifE [Paenibacillus anaericanus]RUT47026.1 nitrogenase iron-molybdenum cofactor biosynthesis protein NifE [Paenibacillus anaericanus]